MNRRYALAAFTVAAMAVAFVSGASVVPSGPKPPAEIKAEDAKPPVVVGHKTAVFNMAAVMRDFHQAKYQVWLLNNKKTEMSKKLLEWREEYTGLQKELQNDPNNSKKDQKSKRMLALARMIEDEDRDINKQLNDDASAIISDLYDMMKEVVDKTAEQQGFQLVLAYPDAVTPEERNSPYIKELKLKPPAAQPFYASSSIDITGRLVEALNEKYPPLDPETKQPVDVSKLDVPDSRCQERLADSASPGPERAGFDSESRQAADPGDASSACSEGPSVTEEIPLLSRKLSSAPRLFHHILFHCARVADRAQSCPATSSTTSQHQSARSVTLRVRLCFSSPTGFALCVSLTHCRSSR